MTTNEFVDSILNGDLNKLKTMIKNGYNPNDLINGSKTPLQLAIENKQNEIIKFLLSLKKINQTESKTSDDDFVAVVGIGCRFPGGADTPEKYWKIFENNVDVTREIPVSRWDNSVFYDPDRDAPGKIYTRYGAFIDQPIEEFDAGFFRINPREAKMMDPQQRLLLEVTYEALENGGIPHDQLIDTQTGVFIGVMTNDYYGLVNDNNQYVATGNVESVLSGRLSYFYGFNGPSVTLNTACSSSLVSLHYAAKSLMVNECNLAIAGGVNLVLSPDMMINACKTNLLSGDGHCKSFDETADGYVRGEGCGILVLKKLTEAVNDGNKIFAVIRGSAINQDGASTGLTVPSRKAQESLIKRALKDAKLSSSDIDYIEAHGTGTSLGDPIEASAISNVFESERFNKLKISTAKSNIGHTEAAAGVAGVIKAIYSIENEMVTKNIHLKNLNQNIKIDEQKIDILKENTKWSKTHRKRRAGVSSFGFSGTNAHVIIEEAPDTKRYTKIVLKNQWNKVTKRYESLLGGIECAELKEYNKNSHLLVLSAKNEKALIDLQKKYIEFLKESKEGQIEQDMCFTASVGRTHFNEHRIAFVFNDSKDLQDKLKKSIDNTSSNDSIKKKQQKNSKNGKIAFLFTGQGSQYAQMGHELYESNLIFRSLMNHCDSLLSRHLESPRLIEIVYGERSNEYLNDTQYAQVSLFSFEYSLACLWMTFGLSPDVVMGHSIGEYVACVLSGRMSLEDGIKLAYLRGRLMKQTQTGKMIAVLYDLNKLERLIQQLGNKVDIAGINSNKQSVVSGSVSDIDELVRLLNQNGCTSVRELNTNKAFHSRYMDPILEEFEREAKTIKFNNQRTNNIVWISTYDGAKTRDPNFTLNSKHWANHLRHKVDFLGSMKILNEMNVTNYIEIGPSVVLTKLAQQCLSESSVSQENILWLNSLKSKLSDMNELQRNLASWYVNGGQVDWPSFHSSQVNNRIILPTYAFQRQSYWIDQNENLKNMSSVAETQDQYQHPLLGRFLCVSSNRNEFIFEHTINTKNKSYSYLLDHKVYNKPLYPGACYIEMVYSAALDISKILFDEKLEISLNDISFQQPLFLDSDEFILQTIVVPIDENTFDFSIYSKNQARSKDTILHSKGSFKIGSDPLSFVSIDSVLERCTNHIDPTQLYETINKRGINYGPAFQPIKQFSTGTNEAYAKLNNDSFRNYSINPVLLDGCFQVLAGLIFNDKTDNYVPFYIKNIKILERRLDNQLNVFGFLEHDDGSEIKGSLQVFDSNGDLLLIVNDLTVKKIDQNSLSQVRDPFNGYFYKDSWKLTNDFDNFKDLIESLNGSLDSQYQIIRNETALKINLVRSYLDKLAILYTSKFFNEINGKRVLNRHDKLYNKLKSLSLDPLPEGKISSLLNEIEQNPFLKCSEIETLIRCGSQLSKVLTGQTEPLGLIFPSVKNVYRESVYSSNANKIVGSIISELFKQKKGLVRILEIGAGTGATTLQVLKSLEKFDVNIEYTYTDISPGFLNDARNEFSKFKAKFEFKVLDIEKDPRVQNSETSHYHVVIATNVLHATKNLDNTLKNVQTLLVDSGLLILSETVEDMLWLDLTFGLLDGWWVFEDSRKHAIMTDQQWVRLLERNGFKLNKVVGDQQAVFISIADKAKDIDCLVFTDEKINFFDQRATQVLREDEKECIKSITDSTGIYWILNKTSTDIAEYLQQNCTSLINLYKSIHKTGVSKFVIVTRGAVYDSIRPEQSVLWAIGKTIQNEDPNLKCILVDLDPTVKDFTLLKSIVNQNKENRIVVRGKKVYISRLEEVKLKLEGFDEFDKDATFVITGSSGGLGKALVEWFSSKGVEKLALISRNQPSIPNVKCYKCDVSDRERLREVINEIETTQGKIGGVFHLSGLLDDALLNNQQWDKFEKVFKAKIYGTVNLHELTLHSNPKYFVIFSSMASLFASIGQANHVSANFFCDSFIQFRRSMGLSGQSINWGYWSEIGSAAAIGADRAGKLKGIDSISKTDGLRILETVLKNDIDQIGVCPIDWKKYFKTESTPNIWFENFFKHRPKAPTKVTRTSKLETDARGIIKKKIIDELRSLLLLPDTFEIDEDQGFFDLGMDSLVVTKFRNNLQNFCDKMNLQVKLSPNIVFEKSNLNALLDHLVPKMDLKKPVEAVETTDKSIAIVGMSCNFPGGSDTPEKFWKVLIDGVDTFSEVPKQRWNMDEFYSHDKIYAKNSGFLRHEIDLFDAGFFKISNEEATYMDPQQRMLLELTWEALERSGISLDEIRNTRTSVFLGIGSNEFGTQLLKTQNIDEVSKYQATGNNPSATAGRLSYFLGVNGPNISINTACSSSLVAVHLACQSLVNNESNLAIVAGVNLMISPETMVQYCKIKMLSKDGVCRVFDNSADGFVRGEGCGVIILKRLEDAKGDNIEGVVRSSVVNQDGASASLMAPNSLAQIALMDEALRKSGLESNEVDFIEAHGTGTALGDPVEIEAISQVYKQRENPLYIGSVKSNIGHLEAAAGIAGLIKTVLSLKHESIPANKNFEVLNENIELDDKKLKIVDKIVDWSKTQRKRRAGVSSFGFSGTNAHVIIEEAPDTKRDTQTVLKNQWNKVTKRYESLLGGIECAELKRYNKNSHLLVLSAKNEKALIDLQKKYIEFLKESKEGQIEQDMCFTASVGRTHFNEHRIAFVFNDSKDLQDKLKKSIDNTSSNDSIKKKQQKNSKNGKIAFLFTGQGSQYAQMGHELYESNLIFRSLMNHCDSLLSRHLESPRLIEIVYGERSNEYLNDTQYAQVALFSFEYSLACLWMTFGLSPDVVMGHSIGEYVACVLSGRMSLEDGIKLAYLRGRLMKQTQTGKMIAVLYDLNKLERLIQQLGNKVDIAGINSNKQSVVSGSVSDIDELVRLLNQNGCTSVRELNTNKAFHSRYMDPILEEFEREAKTIKFNNQRTNNIVWISTYDGAKTRDPNFTLNSKHWANHLRHKVEFLGSMKILNEMNVTNYIEIGPSVVLTKLAQQCLSESSVSQENILWLNSLKSKLSDMNDLQRNLATWYVNGGQVDWPSFHSSQVNNRIILPTYAFQRQSFWPKCLTPSDHSTRSTAIVQKSKPEILETTQKSFMVILNDLLDTDQIDMDQTFFDNGGDSLKVTVFQTRIRKTFGTVISLLEFNTLSLNEISKKFDNSPKEKTRSQVLDDSDRYSSFPLTDIQYAYWIGRQNILGLGGVSAHGYLEVDSEDLDVTRFESAFNFLINRHDMLRVKISSEGTQQVLKSVDEYKIRKYDFTNKDDATVNNHLHEVREELSHQVMDATKWPLFDVRITRLKSYNRIHLSIDSLVFDMFSLKILLDEWHYLYSNPGLTLQPLKVTFRDYVLSNQSLRESDRYVKDKAYWMNKLTTMPMGPALPLQSQPESLKEQKFIRCNRVIDSKTWLKIKNIAKHHRVSTTSVLLTFFSTVLSRYSESPEFLMNLTLFRREEIHEDIHKVLGDFTVLELLSIDKTVLETLDKNFLTGLKLLHNRLWEDLDHTLFNGIEVQRELMNLNKKNQIKSIAPIVFTSLLNYSDTSNTDGSSIWQQFGKVAFSITQTPQIWIDHKTFEANGNLVVEWDYVDGLFKKNMVENMHSAYCKLIEDYVNRDWSLPIPDVLTYDQIEMLNSFNKTVPLINDLTLVELIEKQFLESGDRIAVTYNDKSITYKELDELSRRIGSRLLGVKNKIIGVLMNRSIELVVTLVGIIRSGCAYLPLDPESPCDRLEILLEDSQADFLIKQKGFRQDLKFNRTLEIEDELNRVSYGDLPRTKMDDLAYVLYTSGSTGKPKGVMIEHRAIVNRLIWMQNEYLMTRDDSVLQKTPYTFDVSVWEFFWPLIIGARIVMAKPNGHRDSLYLVETIQTYGITILHFVPSMLKLFLEVDTVGQCKTIKNVFCSGEALPVAVTRKFYKIFVDKNLHNLYGPTEAAVDVSYWDCKDYNKYTCIPIGRPISNIRLFVCNSYGKRVPVGVAGELYIAGIGLARGYLNNTELTEKFFCNFNGERVYKTGDVVRYLDDGNIEYLGRADFQVKVNGVRIELNEIEFNLNKLKFVQDSVVLTSEQKSLVAYVKNSNYEIIGVEKDVLIDDAARSVFKLEHANIRKGHFESITLDKRFILTPEKYFERKSYRQFSSSSIDMTSLESILRQETRGVKRDMNISEFLSLVSAFKDDKTILPKYLYPSAGSSYSVQIYLSINDGNQDNIPEGFYYYNPEEHSLCRIKSSHTKSFRVHLIGHQAAIRPLYGSNWKRFTLIEAGGVVSQLEKNGFYLTPVLNTNLHQDLQLDDDDLIIGSYELARLEPKREKIRTYVYVQQEGLFHFDENRLESCNIKTDYPFHLNYSGDNSTILRHSPFVVIYTGDKTDDSYIQAGKLAMKTSEQALTKNIGLCYLGLSKIDKTLMSVIQGELLLCAVGGVVSTEQLKSRDLTKPKDEQLTISEYLREELKKHLPDYMIPSIYVVLNEFPVSVNGKLDRKSLPPPQETSIEENHNFENPQNEVETKLSELWCELLSLDKISTTANLISLGANSLIITRAHLKIKQTFGVTLEIAKIFNNQTIRSQGGLLKLGNVFEKTESALEKVSILQNNNQIQLFRASFAQQRMWFLQNVLPKDNKYVYHIPLSYELKGDLKLEVLKESLINLFNRHESMRVSFVNIESNLYQKVSMGVPLPFKFVDLSTEMEKFQTEVDKVVYPVFDLNEPPLMRVKVIKTGPRHHFLIIVFHHIITDGDSIRMFSRELIDLYNGLTLPGIKFKYTQFSVWQRALLDEGKLHDQINYWMSYLKDSSNFLDIPTDYPRPSVSTYRGDVFKFTIPGHVRDKLRSLCVNMTLYTPLLTAFTILLNRLSNQNDFNIGVPVSNRQLSETVNMFGNFINTVVVRCLFDNKETVRQVLNDVKDSRMNSLMNQDLPFELLIEKLNSPRDPSYHPIFQVMFIMLEKTIDEPEFKFNDLEVIDSLNAMGVDFDLTQNKVSKFDFTLRVTEKTDHLACCFEYSTDLFKQETIEYFSKIYKIIITKLSEDMDVLLTDIDLPVMDFYQTYDEPTSMSITELFDNQVKGHGNDLAITYDDVSLTYRQLYDKVQQVVSCLVVKGVKQNDVIAINLDSGIEFVSSILAIQQLGACYLPIDPSYPSDRVEFMVQESEAKYMITKTQSNLAITCIITDEFSKSKLVSTPKVKNRDNLAYILYTSGSTGKPKGVEITCGNLWSFIQSFIQAIPIKRYDRWLSVTKPIFDISGVEFYVPLITGGSLIIPTRQTISNIPNLTKILNTVRVFQATPTLWNIILETSWSSVNPEFIGLCGGENMGHTLARSFSKMKGRFFNLYGPTETTIWSSYSEIDKANPVVSIGRPFSNTSLYILDESLKQVPLCVRGELYIGGSSVSRGYRNRKLNNGRFIKFRDSVIYKTGDLVRCDATGMIEYLNRVDFQVKFHGHRIELKEIESVLNGHSILHNGSCVAAIINERLVVFVKTPQQGDEKELKLYLKKYLPNYMLPDSIIFVDSFPMTNNGKINHKALTIPSLTPVKTKIEGSRTQDKVKEVIKEILNIDEIDVARNFFDLGLNSILIMRASLKLTEILKIEVSSLDFFIHTSIETLTGYLETKNVPETLQEEVKKEMVTDKIAIIGMAGRFPKSESVEKFWLNIKNGVDCVEVLSDHELRQNGVSEDMIKNSKYVKSKARIEGLSMFDAEFFNYSTREAKFTNPGQRIMIEEIWTALESSGYGNKQARTGIFVGCGDNDYLKGDFSSEENLSALFGNEKDYLATRMAYKLNLQGPAVNIQTACSSSLVAVHLACQSLKSNETDLCIAGGVSVAPVENTGYLYMPGLMFSPNGRCRTFDESADGIIASQGCGVVVLKRLDDAVECGDNILAVISGSAINNDGSNKIGYTAPSYESQKKVIVEALRNAKTRVEDIGYVEAHGTGTPLGDPIEIKGLTEAFKELSGTGLVKESCAIGSVKTNIGHASTAAGVAGLIKTVLAIDNKEIPPIVNFNKPNPKIDFENGPFYVNQKVRPWNEKRKAGISSFGIGGTNAHVILEEAPNNKRDTQTVLKNQWNKVTKRYESLLGGIECAELKENNKNSHLLVLSAKNEKALIDLQKKYIEFLKESKEGQIEQDMCFTASVGRTHFNEHRIAFVFNDSKDLQDKLKKSIDNTSSNDSIKKKQQKNSKNGKIAFLFTGQGSQYAQMGHELYESNLIFRSLMNHCDSLLSRHLESPRLIEIVYGERSNEYLNDTQYAQVALFSFEYSLACLWMTFGLSPDVVMGHSIGEYVACVLSGRMSLEDGIKLAYLRGRLMKQTQTGKMIAVLYDLNKLERLIQQLGNKVDIAGINSNKQIVVSGSIKDIDDLGKVLVQNGCTSVRELNTNKAFHSRYMDPILEEFEREATTIKFNNQRTNNILWISTYDGAKTRDPNFTLNSKHWSNHLRHKVDFLGSMKIVNDLDVTSYIEIGPSVVLTKLAQQCLSESSVSQENILWLNSLKSKLSDMNELQRNLATWYVNGGQVDWPSFHSSQVNNRIILPTYAFQRQSYWTDLKEETKQLKLSQVVYTENTFNKQEKAIQDHHPLLGKLLCVSSNRNEYIFEKTIDPNSENHSYLLDHRVFDKSLYPAACYIEMAYSSALEISKTLFTESTEILINEINFISPLYLESNKSLTLQTIVLPLNDNKFEFSIYSRTNKTTLHSKGSFKISPKTFQTLNINLNSIRKRCIESLDPIQVYESTGTRGINYGPAFRPIKQFHYNNDEAYAQLNLNSISEGYNFNPVLLDGGFQSTASFLIKSEEMFVPIKVENIEFFSPITSDCFVHVLPGDHSSNGTLVGSVCFYSLTGQLLMIVHSFTIKNIQKKTQDFKFYSETWVNETLTLNVNNNSNSLFIFSTDPELCKETSGFFKNDFRQIIVLTDPNEFITSLKRTTYTFSCLFMAKKDLEYDQDSSELELRSLISLTKALLGFKPEFFGVCTFLNYNVDNTDINLNTSMINGFCRSIQLEHPELKMHQIDSDGSLMGLRNELFNRSDDSIVSYRKDKRYVPRLITTTRTITDRFEFGQDDTFLITGGLGGLGKQVTKWLQDKGVKNLIVLGHKEKRDDVNVHYVDVSNRSSLESVINTRITGVVHLAGSLNDKAFKDMDWLDFEKSIRPKSKGAFNLHELTKNVKYFILFSSMTSLMGSPGQTNYSSANSFLNSLVTFRRFRGLSGQSLIWGPWAQVGMASNLVELNSQRGLDSYTVSEGLEQMELSLSSGESELMLVKADWDKISNISKRMKLYLGSLIKTPMVSENIQAKLKGLPSSLRFKELETILKSIISKYTNSSEYDQGFMDMGMDSLSMVGIRNEIQMLFGDSVELSSTLLFDSKNLKNLTNDLLINVDEEEDDEWTKSSAFLTACGKGNLEIVRMILNKKPSSLNETDRHGRNGLYIATMNNKLEVVKFLLENNVDVSLKSSSGLTALDCAIKKKYSDIESVLRRH